MTKKRNITLALSVAAATALAGYFLYGKRREIKRVKGWILKAKGEVLEKLEKAKTLNEETYHRIVDEVLRRYTKMKEVGEDEILTLSSELKRYWKHIKKDLQKEGGVAATKARRSLRKVVSAGKK